MYWAKIGFMSDRTEKMVFSPFLSTKSIDKNKFTENFSSGKKYRSCVIPSISTTYSRSFQYWVVLDHPVYSKMRPKALLPRDGLTINVNPSIVRSNLFTRFRSGQLWLTWISFYSTFNIMNRPLLHCPQYVWNWYERCQHCPQLLVHLMWNRALILTQWPLKWKEENLSGWESVESFLKFRKCS